MKLTKEMYTWSSRQDFFLVIEREQRLDISVTGHLIIGQGQGQDFSLLNLLDLLKKDGLDYNGCRC